MPETLEADGWAAAAPASAGDDETDDGLGAAQVESQKYAVHLATFRHKRTATRLKSAMTRSGYPARVETVRRGRSSLYRVAVGDYASRQEAERTATQIRKLRRDLQTLVAEAS
jgi:cell division septation protein DedD